MTFNSMYYSFMIIQPSNTKFLHLLNTLSPNTSLNNDNSIIIDNMKKKLETVTFLAFGKAIPLT